MWIVTYVSMAAFATAAEFMDAAVAYNSASSTSSELTANARPWDISSDPMPPYLPKECSTQRLERNNYTFLDNGQSLRLTYLPGYEFFSYRHQTTHSMAGGYNNNYSPVSMITWTNFTDPLNPKAGMQMKVSDGQCDFWPIEGGTSYMGYDYYANLILSLNSIGTPVYFSTSTDPEYGNITSYTVPLINFGGVVNYTASFFDGNKLLYYIADGNQWCCLDYCAEEGEPCREGGTSRYSRTYSEVKYTNYVVYDDDYVWPEALLVAPACPYSTQYCGGTLCPSDQAVEPAGDSTTDYTQKEYDQLAMFIAVPMGLCLVLSWGYIVYMHMSAQSKSRGNAGGDVETASKVKSPMYN
jgi:hypothetical protein